MPPEQLLKFSLEEPGVAYVIYNQKLFMKNKQQVDKKKWEMTKQ